MCYAYFYSLDNNLDKINITLTYINVDTAERKIFDRELDFENLKQFYEILLREYIEFSKIIASNIKKRNQSIKSLDFPYKGYRKGQRKMAVAVYKSILYSKKIFIDAPTGTGKTISTIFPSIKSLSEGLNDKIFYLTAKNTQAKQALNSILKLKEKSLFIKACSITSKEKICINDKVSCNPKDCPYAKGHFDRVNECLKKIIKEEEIFDYDTIREYAKKYKVCPLELELDIASYSDIIICDYNYVFDPSVYLRRFFDESSDKFTALIDEAHNLYNRARSSFSASLNKNRFLQMNDIFKEKKCKKIINLLESISCEFEKIYTKTGKKIFYYTQKYIDTFDEDLENLLKELEKYLINQKDDTDYDLVQEFYFDVLKYLRISDYFSDGFYNTLSFDEKEDDLILEIKCVDPSEVLKNRYEALRSVIFFSATLSPMKFYMKILGGEDALKLHLDLPFEKNNLLILNSRISTRYKDRIKNISIIADNIHEFINSKEGNYFIYFPSYAFMTDIYDNYKEKYDTENILIQQNILSEEERFEFLQNFTYESKKIAFLVLGGIFSEGVDLKGDRLIASMIISVGMPGVSNNRNLIKEYFDNQGLNGFEYAYTFPGINKVFQAAGRVIRTENDRGIVLLLDDRFSYNSYRRLYPRHWMNIEEVNIKNMKNKIDRFWRQN